VDFDFDDFSYVPGDVLTIEILRRGEPSDDRVAKILADYDPLLTLQQSRWGRLGFVAVYKGRDASRITRRFASLGFTEYSTGIPYEPIAGEDVILAPVGSGWLHIRGESAEAILEECGEVDGRDIYYDVEPPDGDYFRIQLGEGHAYITGDPGRALLNQLSPLG